MDKIYRKEFKLPDNTVLTNEMRVLMLDRKTKQYINLINTIYPQEGNYCYYVYRNRLGNLKLVAYVTRGAELHITYRANIYLK